MKSFAGTRRGYRGARYVDSRRGTFAVETLASSRGEFRGGFRGMEKGVNIVQDMSNRTVLPGGRI